MIADKIKELREANHWTQTQLAKKLNITRSSVNAWEMGISAPSTVYLVELSQIFGVSTDYLLGLSTNHTLDISELSQKEVSLLCELISYFRTLRSQIPSEQGNNCSDRN